VFACQGNLTGKSGTVRAAPFPSRCCLRSIFNKLIDENGHLDMRNVTTLIWVNRKRFDIVETIVELLIEVSELS